jgi:hypothetical protein
MEPQGGWPERQTLCASGTRAINRG